MPKDSDLIKEKIDLVDFLRGYLTLHPAGRNFKALCPFHDEKTPSFIVSPDRKIWHCFGCGLGGDVLGFAMRYENLEFPEAIRFLAERAGLEIRSINPAVEKEFGILYKLHDIAKDFFQKELLKHEGALKYLKGRGLEEETIRNFDLGYAPGGDSLTLHLIKEGFDVLDIQRAGMTHKNLKGLYRDRFESRIIFPIKNQFGRTVAFTGRLLENPNTPSDLPKYLNSPETPIFNKSKILYGLSESKAEISKTRTVFLMEGQMDYLMSSQSGVKNCVAVSGTGLTEEHLKRLRRMADTVIVTFDNDEAGLRALERSLDVFNNFDFHVKVIDLGEYKDPAEAVLARPDYLREKAEEAIPAFNHLFNFYFENEENVRNIAHKKRILRHLLSKIKNVRSAVEQNIWIHELARLSGVREDALIAELNQLPQDKGGGLGVPPNEPEPEERLDKIASRLISLALADGDHFKQVVEKIAFFPETYKAILKNPKEAGADFLALRSSFDFAKAEKKDLDSEFRDLLRYLEIESLKKDRASIQGKIRLANVKNVDAEPLMDDFHKISKRIDELSSFL